MIALFASTKTNHHEKTYEKNQDLHILVNRKKEFQLILITMEKNRLKHPQENCKNEIKKHIAFMEKQIKMLEKKIDEVIKKDEDLSKKIKIVESVPGIGRTSAAIFVFRISERVGNITNKQMSSLAGVAPHPRESGQSKGKISVTGGRYFPRSTLFMIALVASRHNDVFQKILQ